MKLAKQLVVATALTAIGGLAQAATVDYIITGGNWDSLTQWNNNANASFSTRVYDNGQTPGCDGFPSGFNCWGASPGDGPVPGPMTGTYGGTITVDTTTNAVVGGQLSVTGGIADMVFVGTAWWVRQYNDLTIDFATNTATVSSNQCYQTFVAPAGCFAVINPNSHVGLFAPLGGIASQDPAGAGGTAYLGATFDANTGLLQLFRDGRSVANPGGTDALSNFTLQAQVVPVPAAAWLFGSALGLLGVARRKLAA